jgi:NADH-quinone oxidoreductase subunit C
MTPSALDVARSVADEVGGVVEDRFGTITVAVPVDAWSRAAAAFGGRGLDVLDKMAAIDESGAPEGPATDVVAVLVRDPGRGLSGAWVLLRTRLVGDTALPSLTDRYASAAWHEREMAELMGVRITGFREDTPAGPVTEPRPLLTAGWSGPPPAPPLRKSAALPARAGRPWPGAREPVEPAGSADDAHRRRTKGRRPLPPGVPPG